MRKKGDKQVDDLQGSVEAQPAQKENGLIRRVWKVKGSKEMYETYEQDNGDI